MAIIKNPISIIKQETSTAPEPLCFETVDATLASTAQRLTITNASGNAPVLQYSYDKTTWTDWDYSYLTFGGATKVYIRGNNPQGFSNYNNNYSKFGFAINGVKVKCSGEIISLSNYQNKVTRLTYGEFYSLFLGASALQDVSGLTLPSFVSQYCYCTMLKSCTSLTTAPELPAETLADSCYNLMFQNCPALTTAPALPAETLASNCYYQMFYQCTSLTTAPDLPATATVTGCYTQMFDGCTNLASIVCNITSPNSSHMTNWLSGVSATGDFYKDANATWTTGVSGIPSGWTVHDIS